MKKKIVIAASIAIICVFFYVFKKKFETKKKIEIPTKEIEVETYKSNIIQDVEYISKDNKGNEYIINAKKGEIDFTNTTIIFLTDVKMVIKLVNSNNIYITSDYGKYDSNNFDTVFSKNVIITYLENKITGEYLDFSINRNSMIISRSVVYKNLENILKADVIEMNLKTKDIKIFMYEDKKKVNIKNLN